MKQKEQKMHLDLMDGLAMLPESQIDHEWDMENITKTFFKCTRWQLEGTADFIYCPYHYFCDSTYPGDYPSIVDSLVLLFAVSSFLSTTAFTLMGFRRNTSISISNLKRRYLLPSGPIALPLVLLIFAKGHRINTIFPLSHMGPAILQLVYISALAFKNQTEKDLHYAVLEASTVSGILHASSYLDNIILPYYTGFEALTESTFSGECATCVCRKNALVVGGSLISYRGWSKTTMSIISVLFSRILCKINGEEKLSLLIKSILEVICWLLIASDSITLMFNAPQGGFLNMVVYGGLCFLISLSVFRKLCTLLAWLAARCQMQRKIDLYNAAIV
uniref:Uncharacterized protein LOC105043235 n=1 Tax=Elaeis guineensis var. tenera TaxID=51953 RepID=A0A6I9R1X2_ELAGV|nr:uncharacterized protein LOC105043235 [Elaeis guineensis]